MLTYQRYFKEGNENWGKPVVRYTDSFTECVICCPGFLYINCLSSLTLLPFAVLTIT